MNRFSTCIIVQRAYGVQNGEKEQVVVEIVRVVRREHAAELASTRGWRMKWREGMDKRRGDSEEEMRGGKYVC